MGDRHGFPAKQTIIAARDHVIETNPKLRVVGVHLGSMEKSLNEIAQRLDRYPNFAIDTGGRLEYLMRMPTERVRDFFVKYQDRILCGTDLELIASADISQSVNEWQLTYTRDWMFLATDRTLSLGDKQVRALNLPA